MGVGQGVADADHGGALVRAADLVGGLGHDGALSVEQRHGGEVGTVGRAQQGPAKGQDQGVAGVDVV